MRSWMKYAVSFFVLCLLLTAVIVVFGPGHYETATDNLQPIGVQKVVPGTVPVSNPGQPEEIK